MRIGSKTPACSRISDAGGGALSLRPTYFFAEVDFVRDDEAVVRLPE